IAGCASCGGIWIDNAAGHFVVTGQLSDDVKAFAEDLAARGAENARRGAIPTGYRARAVPGAGERVCPVCEAPLVQRHLRDGDLDVDLCEQHGTYFDVHELVRTAQSVEARILGERVARRELEERLAEGRAGATAARAVAFALHEVLFPRQARR